MQDYFLANRMIENIRQGPETRATAKVASGLIGALSSRLPYLTTAAPAAQHMLTCCTVQKAQSMGVMDLCECENLILASTPKCKRNQ